MEGAEIMKFIRNKIKARRETLIATIIAIIMMAISAIVFISMALYDNNGVEIKAQAQNSLNLIKFVNYETDGKEMSLLAFNLKEGVSYNTDYYSPVKDNSVYLKIPAIDGKLPNQVEVISISSKATNGMDEQKDATYEYNSETGILHIFANNEADEEGNQYYGQSSDYDEYAITFYYDSKIETETLENNRLNVQTIIQYNSTNEEIGFIQGNYNNEIILEEKGDLISTQSQTSEVYNGYIKSNIANGTDYETEFTQNMRIDVSDLRVDEIILEEANGFRNTDNQVSASDEIIYKQIKINQSDVQRILGDEGYLQVLDETGALLLEINKDTEAQDKQVVFHFEQEVGKIVIKTSKPVQKGIIRIEATKAIKPEMKNLNNNYFVTAQKIIGTVITKEETEQLENVVETTQKVEYTQNIATQENETTQNTETEETEKASNAKEEDIENTEASQEEKRETILEHMTTDYSEIKNATTNVKVNIDNTQWTNNITNSVNIVATLVTSDEKYNLFKSPTLEIELPEQVEKVVLGDSYLLNANGLSLENVTVIDKENGKKAIVANITGSQTSYLFDNMIDGTNVIIPATIVLKKEFTSTASHIQIQYTNEIEENSEIGTTQIEVNLESIMPKNEQNNLSVVPNNDLQPSVLSNAELVQTLKDTNGLTIDVVAEVGADIVARSGTSTENNVQNGDVYERQIIKYTVTLTNNSDQTITDLSVTGQIPENSNYATVQQGKIWNEELGEWVDNIQDDLVYDYIIDEEVTTYQFEDMSTLQPGDSVTGWYEVKLKDLADAVDSSNLVNNIAVKIGEEEFGTYPLTNTLHQAEIEVKLKAQINASETDQFSYKIDIINLTETDLNNISIETSEFPKELEYVSSVVMYSENASGNGVVEDNKLKITIDHIRARTTEEKEQGLEAYESILITFKGKNYDENVNEVDLEMTARATVNDTTYSSNENRIKAYPQYVTAVMTLDKEGQEVKIEDELTYTLTIKNEAKVRSLVNISANLPEAVEGVQATYSYYDVGEDTKTDYDIEAEANAEFELVERTIDLSVKIDGQDDIFIPAVIPAGKTITITIKAKAGYVTQSTEASFFATVYGDTIETVVSNIATVKVLTDVDWDHIDEPDDPDIPTVPDPDDPYNEDEDIEEPDPEEPEDPEDPDPPLPEAPDEPDDSEDPNTPIDPYPDDPEYPIEPDPDWQDDPDDPEDPDTPVNPDDPDNPEDPENPDDPDSPDNPEDPDTPTEENYEISGIVWVDENEDGRRIETERRLTGVTVKLFNADTNAIVVINNTRMAVEVNENGEYNFSNIPKGRYFCLFEYDTQNYEITAYQKSGVGVTVNNDASKAEVSIDGVVKNVGITDVLEINNGSLTNIDLGLIENKTFNLKLEKYISKVIVSNSQGDREYTYQDNTALAKVEVPAKYIDGTVVTIEYKFIITNEGNIPGYVNEITDYIPEGLSFLATNNDGWSVGSDGNAKNSSLTTTTIEPGESKTLLLYLTKVMTEDSSGNIKNSAEITRSSNTKNIEDQSAEDNAGSAEIIISISTGVYRNILIMIGIMILLILLLLVIKKYHKKLPTLFMVFMMVILMGINTSNAENITWVSDPGILSNGWHCAHEGLHQCAKGTHSYSYTVTRSVTGTTGRVIQKDVTLTKSGSPEFRYLNSNYNIVGPYTVTCNYDIKASNVTATFNTTASYTICNANGTEITWTSGKSFTFYVKVPKSVSTVTGVNVSVTVENIGYETQSIAIYYYATCYEVGPYHENAEGQSVSVSPSGVQPADKHAYDTDTQTFDGTVSCDFGAVYSGSLVIRKKDASTNEDIGASSGAEFTVVGPGGESVATGVKIGQVITGLPAGTYTVLETKAPTNYNLELQYLDEKTITRKSGEVEAGETTRVTFYNQKYTSLLIKKKDKDSEDPIKGMGFTVYDNHDKKYIRADGSKTNSKTTLYTDANGEIWIQNIKIYDTNVEFTITEVASNNKYYPVVDTKVATVKVKNNANGNYTGKSISNEKAYDLILRKRDMRSGERVEATFSVQYEDGTWLTSNGGYSNSRRNIQTENGNVRISGIKYGTYHVYEVGVQSGYELSAQENYDASKGWVDCGTVTINKNDEDGEVSVVYYNKRYTSVGVKKVDADTGQGIEGIGFTIYNNERGKYVNSAGQHVNNPVTIYTDANGQIYIPKVLLEEEESTFTFSEVASTNLYYKADTSIKANFTVKSNSTGQYVEGTITNKKAYSLTVYKKDNETGKNINATFAIKFQDGTWLTSSGGYSSSQTNLTTTNGTLTINGIKRGTYRVYEVGISSGYRLDLQDGYDASKKWVDWGNLTVNDNNPNGMASKTCTNKKYTNLEIKKIDDETSQGIEGIGFTIYDNHYKKYITATGTQTSTPTTIYTDASGIIHISNVLLYDDNTTFTIQEVDSRNLYYKSDTTISGTISGQPNGTVEWSSTTLKNKKAYSLTVEKKDPDKTTENLTAYFYIQYQDGTWLTQSGDYSNSPSSITVSKTLTIPEIKRGSYHIYEYQTPTGYDITQQDGYGADTAHPTWVDCGISYVGINTNGTQNNNLCSVTVSKDNKKYISKITGYVWVENRSGKANEYNYRYDSGEERLAGVRVEFVTTSGNVIATTTTGSNGSYEFSFHKQILYWNLQNYMVRFTYDNQTYTTVPANLEVSVTNGSRAMESHDWGADVYATGTGNATTIPNATRVEDSIAKYYNANNYCIETINLGIMVKPNEEFSIIENLDYVRLVKGNYTFTYEYGKEAVVQNVPEREYIYDTVALQNSARSFTQKLYPSDIAYNYTVTSNKFEVYVGYKISITNTMNINMNDLYVERALHISSLTNTYNTTIYELSDSAWRANGNGSATYNNAISPIASGQTVDVSVQFKVVESGLQELIQGAKENPDVYKEAATTAIANGYHTYTRNDSSWTYASSGYRRQNEHRTRGETRQSSALTLRLILSEQRTISGTVFEDRQTTQSAQNHTRLGNGVYDTDENNLKVVTVSLLNSEDGQIASLYSTEGDYLRRDENGIWMFEKQPATVEVNDDGNYTLVGVIPGEYYLSFTYSNGTQIVTDTEGNPIDLNNYKSTILTGAAANNTEGNWFIDVMGGRNSIATDKYYISQDGSVLEDIIPMRTTSTKELNYASIQNFNQGKIQALSANMSISFEYIKAQNADYDYNFTPECSGMSFGIIERAHTEIRLDKQISTVKLTLSNGTTIINGNPQDSNVSRYLTAMNTSYAKIEMDNSLLYGSTLSITYELIATNDSEIDYATQNYYEKGVVDTGALVTTAVTKIVDYISNADCTYTGTSENIQLLENYNQADYFEPGLDNSAYVTQVLEIPSTTVRLSPSYAGTGESSTSYFVTVNKLLSNSSEDLGMETYSEIIGLTNVTFTPQYTSHSGNYKAGDSVSYPAGTSEADNAEAIMAITPSTGENRSNTIYIIAGLVLVVLAGGIIILKKRVR